MKLEIQASIVLYVDSGIEDKLNILDEIHEIQHSRLQQNY